MSPLTLTLELDPNSFEIFNALRKAHFPPERNFLDAHVTLFHKLLAEEETSLKTTLETLVKSTKTFNLTFSTLRFLGKGVAVNIESAKLIKLRETLVNNWQPWLEV